MRRDTESGRRVEALAPVRYEWLSLGNARNERGLSHFC